jgi:hypothetical protein
MNLHTHCTLIGQNTQMGGSQHGSRWGNDIADVDVAARLADEGSRLQLTSDDHAVAIGGRLGLFDHADCVCSERDRCAGHDAHRLAPVDREFERVAGHDGTDHAKTDGCA